MKILVATTISNTINAFLVPHIQSQLDEGHEVHVCCNIIEGLNKDLIQAGCKVHDIQFERSPLKKGNFGSYGKIKKLVAKEKFDLIHTHTPVASFLIRMVCRKLTSKVLYTAHGFHFYKGAPIKNWAVYYPIEFLAARWTDYLITINQEDFRAAHKFPLKKNGSVHLIPGIGVNTSQYCPVTNEERVEIRKELGFSKKDFLLIYAAEFNANKNQLFLLSCLKDIRKECPDIKLLLAGDGDLRQECTNYILQHNMEDCVKLLGYRKDLPKIIPCCDVGVSVSFREGLGLHLIEYMSCKLPIVASKNRGHNEIIQHKFNGYLYDSQNKSEFIHYLKRLYKDAALREKMGNRSQLKAQEFSLENSLLAMDSIYQKHLHMKKNSSPKIYRVP